MTITHYEDIMDSREIRERIEELVITDDRDDEEQHELDALVALAEEGAQYAEDWDHGVVLIRDSYFQEYAEQLADEIGAINADATWPNNYIDWERAAEALKYDYSGLDFDGVRYWVR